MADEGQTICFLELPEEAQVLGKWLAEGEHSSNDVIVVALSIEVQALLTEMDLAYVTTLELVDSQTHSTLLTRAEELLTEFENLIDLRINEGAVRDVYSDSASFVAQYLINYFLFFTTVIDNAVKKWRPECIWIAESGRPPRAGRFKAPVVDDDEGFVNSTALEYARENGVDVEVVAYTGASRNVGPKTAETGPILAAGYRALIGALRGRSSIVFAGGGGTNQQAIVRILANIWPGHLLGFSDSPTWRGLVKGLLNLVRISKGVVEIPRRSGIDTEACDHVEAVRKRLGCTKPSVSLSGKLTHCGVDFTSVFGCYLDTVLWEYLDGMAERVAGQLASLERLSVTHVVATGAREENLALGEWAREHALPFVMVPHGTAIAPKNRCEEIENRNLGRSLILSPVVKVAAIQSPIQADHARFFQPACETIETGPILFGEWNRRGDRIQGKRERRGPVTILLGSSYKNRGALRFWAMETPDEYLESCRDLVDAINGLTEDVRLLIRFHPKLKMAPDDFRKLLPETDRLEIERGGRFLDSLNKSDLVVNFSSTSIEESLQSDVPVLLYDPWQRYRHCEAQEIDDPDAIEPSAVYYLASRDHLKKTIEVIVDRHLLGDIREDLFAHHQIADEKVANFVRLFSPDRTWEHAHADSELALDDLPRK